MSEGAEREVGVAREDGPFGERDERIPALHELVFDAGADYTDGLLKRTPVHVRHARNPMLNDRLGKVGL
jgi:hypothetical protein